MPTSSKVAIGFFIFVQAAALITTIYMVAVSVNSPDQPYNSTEVR